WGGRALSSGIQIAWRSSGCTGILWIWCGFFFFRCFIWCADENAADVAGMARGNLWPVDGAAALDSAGGTVRSGAREPAGVAADCGGKSGTGGALLHACAVRQPRHMALCGSGRAMADRTFWVDVRGICGTDAVNADHWPDRCEPGAAC